MATVALSLPIGPSRAFLSYYGDTGPDWPRLFQRLPHLDWSPPPPRLLEGGGNDRSPLVETDREPETRLNDGDADSRPAERLFFF